MMAAISDVYVGWGGALGAAYGNILGGASVNATNSILSVGSTTDSTAAGLYGITQQYVYPHQEMYNNIRIDAIQSLQNAVQKPVEKAKRILESLRSEINNWCSNVLEVA